MLMTHYYLLLANEVIGVADTAGTGMSLQVELLALNVALKQTPLLR